LPKDYMEILLNIVDDVAQDENEFEKAKMQAQIFLDSFENVSIAVILTALYLSVMALIDTVEIKTSIIRNSN
jgi:hypothetical protein